MSKINELIKRLCPNGVKYKKLKDIAIMQRGQSITIKELVEGDIPVIAGGQEPSFYNDKYNRDGETITVSSSGAYAGHLNYWNEPILCTDSFTIKSDNINMRFLYHYLKMNQYEIYNKKKGAGIPHVHISDLENFKIATPPLEVQKEIVRILDKFGKLEAELEAELEARKKQYEFWREKLLNIKNNNYKKYNITEICKNISAGGDVPEDTIKGISNPQDDYKYPVISNGVGENAIYGYSKNYRVDVQSCVTIAARGTIGYHEVRYGKFTPIVRLITLIPNEKIVSAKYLNYALYGHEFKPSGGSIPQLTTPTVKQLDLIIPPIEEQNRIVSILDIFNALVNDITAGLPAEIELRRKQYEYYRNKLLSFEEMK